MSSPWLSIVLKIALAVVGVWVLFVVLIWRFQTRIVFPGVRTTLPAPAVAGLAGGERVTVEADQGVLLHGWFVPPDPPPVGRRRAPGLIWFYGNMETVAGLAPVLRAFRPPGVGLLALDYRGYGESEGTPRETDLYRDAEKAWHYLAERPEIDSARIGVYGRSIGSAIAMHLATSRPVAAVVLESPFTTARAMARTHYPLVPPGLLRMTLDNVGRAAALDAPLLVVHGTEDDIAPLWMGRQVAEAGRAVEFFVIDGAGHNETYLLGGERYRARFHQFMHEHLRSPDPPDG